MEDKIFSVTEGNFERLAIEVFHFQYALNPIYQSWVKTLGINEDQVSSIEQIPFLPISFFKTHQVLTTSFQPEIVFESSGTTGTTNSHHYVKSRQLYEESFIRGFELFYGNPDQYVILGLLPSYLERNNSSLVVMVDALIKKSNKKASGFYLYEHDQLQDLLINLRESKQQVILFGVTFALLDFAEKRKLSLPQTIVIVTGGMKGRREEMTREQVHSILNKSLGVQQVHSEYGMTELLSQAYAREEGIFQSPPWMKVLIRDEDDPLSLKTIGGGEAVKGAINIIDLANLYSCSFVATEDLGTVYPGGFTVDGRLDKSDLRGCSLLTI
jgi:phenylacetate-coenzyme A ligase PaaK-like adenylate-forming protein